MVGVFSGLQSTPLPQIHRIIYYVSYSIVRLSPSIQTSSIDSSSVRMIHVRQIAGWRNYFGISEEVLNQVVPGHNHPFSDH